MVKFEEVQPDEMLQLRDPRRVRVSYPILKGFLETGFFLAKIDRTGMQQSLQALTATLGAYVRSHEMPVRVLNRKGEIFLMRLDIDENKEPIPDWNKPEEDDPDARPITNAEVASRFEEEKDLTTK